MSSCDLDHWFVTNVLPLEPALVRFLRRYWKDEGDVVDLRQETFVRVYEAAAKKLPQHPKAFTFMVARNLVLDQIRRARVVPIELVADYETLPLLTEELGVEEAISIREELVLLEQAIKALPSRCREVVVMRKIHGYSQRATADALGIAESTVERQVSKGVRWLADSLHRESPGRGSGRAIRTPRRS